MSKQHPIDDYAFWVCPTYRRRIPATDGDGTLNVLCGWRADVYIKEAVDSGDMPEPITTTDPQPTPADALAAAVTFAEAYEWTEEDETWK